MTPPGRLYADQLRELTQCEWKLREQSSVLGFLWTLLQPLLMFGVLYALFTKWMGHHTSGYASYLLIGIVEWGFFASATSYGLTSFLRRSGILLNFKIDRELVVYSAILSVLISYLFELALMLAFAVALGARVSPSWAAFPLLIAVQLALVTGLTLLLAVLAARFPDVERIWSILLMSGFFLTPIFYSLDSISPGRRRLLELNPMTHLIEMSRDCVLAGRFPAPGRLAALGLAAAALSAAAYGVFKLWEIKIGDWVATR